jgi:uncharacterized protein with PQ loop repeat
MYDYLMNAASFIYIACYVPELYANWKNKNANIYNMPEKVIIIIGTGFAFAYSVLNQDNSLIINYGPILMLDLIALLMRAYYVWKNTGNAEVALSDTTADSSPGDASPGDASP